jgi:hypothetical protein
MARWIEVDMKIDGGCHCGFITYEAEVDPGQVAICHCTDCQTLSGSAFRTVAFTRDGSFKLLSGRLKIYVKTSESGAQREQNFCPECGTSICSAPVGDRSKTYIVRVGTVRQRDQLVPKMQLWCRSSQQWIGDIGAIPTADTQPSFDKKGGLS